MSSVVGGPQGRAGRKFLAQKIEVECIEEGCTNTLFTNHGNASKGVRCEEHRRLHLNKLARERNRKRANDEFVGINRLVQLRSFKIWVNCRNEFCNHVVEVDGLAARHPRGVYCEACREEAERIHDRNYYSRRGKLLRQKRQLAGMIAA